MEVVESMSLFAGHRVIFACDIVGFGHHARTDSIQGHLRAELHTRVGTAFAASGISLSECHTEDRGDGLLAVAPPGVRAGTMVAPLADYIDAELRRQHEVAAEAASLRLRVSVHAGEVYQDEYGITGHAIIEAFRLLDAPALKRRITETRARLALIISDRLYNTVIRQDPGGLSDPAIFAPLHVVIKETDTTGWVRLFGASAPELITLVDGLEGGAHQTRDQLALARRLLTLPALRTTASRARVIGALPPDLIVARQPEPVLDIFCLIQACLEYPDGIPLLSAALQ
ncbi:effector-associated domain 2-containing protein [Actinomadura scrupuli]|uniref:effector-associated domain 2-containing protein n=1 Tax=Actinomadura scrupuli TaxID=559629 RepID=UPI003D97EFD0